METTGRNVHEAVEAALDELGVDEQDVEVVVVSEPRAAFFGLRKSEARIRARVRPASPRPKRHQRDRRGRTQGRNRRSVTPDGDRHRPAQEVDGKSPRRPSAEVDTVPTAGAAVAATRGASGARSSEAVPKQEIPGRRRRRSGRSSRPASTGTGASEASEEDVMGPEEQARVAEQFVSGVVERFGLTARTTVKHADEEVIEISIDGADLGILIGPKGSTLNALQELTRTVAQRRSGERGARLVVDVAGYRARRTAALEQFARQVAEEVRAAGVPRALEPMSAADRKTVHDALSSFEGVATSSEGEDPHRHVVVRPEEAGGAAEDSAAESEDGHPEDEQPPEGDDHDAAEDELAADGSRPA